MAGKPGRLPSSFRAPAVQIREAWNETFSVLHFHRSLGLTASASLAHWQQIFVQLAAHSKDVRKLGGLTLKVHLLGPKCCAFGDAFSSRAVCGGLRVPYGQNDDEPHLADLLHWLTQAGWKGEFGRMDVHTAHDL